MPDIEKIINSIKACAHHPNHDCESCDYCADNFWCLNDQLIEDFETMMREQEAVEPRVSTAEQRCGHCNKVIEMDGWQSCPWCGKRIDWKGWWKKNGTRNQDSGIIR